MCGRFTLSASAEMLSDRFEVPNMKELSIEPAYNIAPSQPILSIIHDGAKRRAGFLKWGLVPSWSKDPKIGNKMINARVETASEKPAFRNAFKRRRCLIIADGFYEWQKTGDKKIPMRIQLESGAPFAFAGLWEKWEREEGEALYTCTILTRAANEFMEPIHSRMPVILSGQAEHEWLDPNIQDPRYLEHLLDIYPEENLEAYEVSDLVNSPQNDTPQCIRPI
ncbi:SOS response-associated peptidase [Bacillus marinisedimentorum]|uniref:SOS response-associated peptidase n=1 Tax=Bacillus marinisedimentorum TaxID=1821260 RepID=UPI0008725A64|nr:SOS response-associated peptidase [Bacillus marinisedimentorum]